MSDAEIIRYEMDEGEESLTPPSSHFPMTLEEEEENPASIQEG